MLARGLLFGSTMLVVLLSLTFVSVDATLDRIEADAIKDLANAIIGLNGSGLWTSNPNCNTSGITCVNQSGILHVRTILIDCAALEIQGGSIPSTISNLDELENLTMSYCGLSGFLPAGMQELNDLKYLTLESITKDPQPYPSWIPRLPAIELLSLRGNMLTGSVNFTFKSADVHHIDLSSNNLSGNISSAVSQIPDLDYLNLSRNKFTGTIPDFGLGTGNLIYLNLSSNVLSGDIPNTLFALNGKLDVLDLSNNYISGSSQDLSLMTFVTCNLSNNAASFMCKGPDTCCNSSAYVASTTKPDFPFSTSLATSAATPSSTLLSTSTLSSTSLSTSTSSSTSTSLSITTTVSPSTTSSCVGYQCACSSNLGSISTSTQCISGTWVINGSANNNGTLVVGAVDTVTINGSFSQSQNSSLAVYSSKGSSGKIEVAGDVQIQGGNLTIILSQAINNDTSLLILHGANITGQFDSVNVIYEGASKNCKYAARPAYTATDMSVVLSKSRCDGSKDHKILIIAISCSVGGVLLLAIIAIVILTYLQQRGKLLKLFWSRNDYTEHLID